MSRLGAFVLSLIISQVFMSPCIVGHQLSVQYYGQEAEDRREQKKQLEEQSLAHRLCSTALARLGVVARRSGLRAFLTVRGLIGLALSFVAIGINVERGIGA